MQALVILLKPFGWCAISSRVLPRYGSKTADSAAVASRESSNYVVALIRFFFQDGLHSSIKFETYRAWILVELIHIVL